MAGYSGTPLAKKLGMKDGFHIRLINTPDHYLSLFTDLPTNLFFDQTVNEKSDIIHFFTKDTHEYKTKLPELMKQIKSNGMIWISWPKKASKVSANISEESIRNFAIEIGLVDVKVCAIDAIWSGLKLVIPLRERIV
jgi:hypothetical protein